MTPVTLSLVRAPETFERLIKNPTKDIVCDKQGNFYEESFIISLIKRIVIHIFGDLFHMKIDQQVGWVKGLVIAFDQLEQKRVPVNKPKYLAHLKAAKSVKALLKESPSPQVKEALLELKIRTLSLKYRLGSGYSEKYAKQSLANVQLLDALKPVAEDWKQKQIVYKTPTLTPNHIHQLEILTQYPQFAALVKDHPLLRERFFTWALLEGNNVDAFVQFSRTVDKMIDVGLSKRIGKHGGKDLQIEEVEINGKRYKDLTLSFELSRESILDETHVVTLAYDYKLSIQEIFKIFEERIFRVGNVEYIGNKIRNWNVNEWGAYNPAKKDYERLDVNNPEEIKKIPFSEIITEEEAHARFVDAQGQKLIFEPQDWIFTIVAKNEYEDAKLTGAHTMLCMAVPLENGQRGLCYISKFLWDFPVFETEKIKYIRIGFDTLKAALQMPDENFYHMGRGCVEISYRATEEQARKILKSIAKDKANSEKGLLHFQIFISNCTHWVFEKLRTLIPSTQCHEMAAMHIWDTKPQGLSTIFKLPLILRKAFFDLLIFVARPRGQIKKGKTEKMIQLTHENAPWKTGFLLHPQGVISGFHEKRNNRI